MTNPRPFGIAVATIAIAAAVVFVWRHEGQRRRDLEGRAAVLRTELARSVPREVQPHPALSGGTRDGEATVHYRRAARLWVEAEVATGPAESLLARTSDDDAWEAIEVVLAGGAPALDALRAACASATLDVGALWRSGSATGLDDVVVADHQWHALCLVVHRHLRAREHAAAIESTAHLLTWCRDVEYGAPVNVLLAGAAIENLSAAWSDEALLALDAASLASLATVLQRFEETAAPLERSALACLLGSFEALHTHGDAIPRRARTIEELVGLADRIRDSGPGWTAREAALTVAEPLPGTELGHFERHARESRARIRLLRMAVAHHRGERLVLDDPLGDGAFAVGDGDGSITFRCASASADGSPLERTARRR